MDPDWTLPSRMDDNIVAWRVSVDGFIMDARYLPREIRRRPIAWDSFLMCLTDGTD